MGSATATRLGSLTSLCAALCLLTSCGAEGDPSTGQTHRYTTEASSCESGPAERQLEIVTNSQPIGSNSNALVSTDDDLWVVESGDNTLSPVDEGSLIDVGNGRNPYDAAYDAAGGRLFITNFQSDTVSVADLESGEISREIEHDSLDRPTGVAVSDNYVYVTNTAFRAGNTYEEGSVTVIDPGTLEVLGSIPTGRKNPQFATWAETSVGPRLLVVDTGALAYDAGDFSAGPSAVEIWKETPDPLTPEKTVAELDVPADANIGAPGRAAITLDGSRAYFTSATAPVLFELDLETGEWIHGADDPIELYDAQDDALDHAAMGRDGVLYVSAFNHEQLLLLDTRCNELIGAFDISTSDVLNAGPHAIAIDESDADSTHGYIVGSISNSLIEFSVE